MRILIGGGVVLIGLLILSFFMLNRGGSSLRESRMWFKMPGGIEAGQELRYETKERVLRDGQGESSSTVNLPTGAQITVNTTSSDNVQVTSMRQEGEKTIVVLEPVDTAVDQN